LVGGKGEEAANTHICCQPSQMGWGRGHKNIERELEGSRMEEDWPPKEMALVEMDPSFGPIPRFCSFEERFPPFPRFLHESSGWEPTRELGKGEAIVAASFGPNWPLCRFPLIWPPNPKQHCPSVAESSRGNRMIGGGGGKDRIRPSAQKEGGKEEGNGPLWGEVAGHPSFETIIIGASSLSFL